MQVVLKKNKKGAMNAKVFQILILFFFSSLKKISRMNNNNNTINNTNSTHEWCSLCNFEKYSTLLSQKFKLGELVDEVEKMKKMYVESIKDGIPRKHGENLVKYFNKKFVRHSNTNIFGRIKGIVFEPISCEILFDHEFNGGNPTTFNSQIAFQNKLKRKLSDLIGSNFIEERSVTVGEETTQVEEVNLTKLQLLRVLGAMNKNT